MNFEIHSNDFHHQIDINNIMSDKNISIEKKSEMIINYCKEHNINYVSGREETDEIDKSRLRISFSPHSEGSETV